MQDDSKRLQESRQGNKQGTIQVSKQMYSDELDNKVCNNSSKEIGKEIWN